MMSCQNLAIVFAPNILRPPQANILSAMKDNGKVFKFIHKQRGEGVGLAGARSGILSFFMI